MNIPERATIHEDLIINCAAYYASNPTNETHALWLAARELMTPFTMKIAQDTPTWENAFASHTRHNEAKLLRSNVLTLLAEAEEKHWEDNDWPCFADSTDQDNN